MKNLKTQPFAMKPSFLVLTILFTSLLSAQQTISVEQYNNYLVNGIDIPDSVTKVIDSNNSFDPFIGTWAGEHDGLEYQFIISKISESDDDYERFEYMEIRYLLTDGIDVVADTRQEESESISVFLDRMPTLTKADFYVVDGDECNNELIGTFKLIPESSSTLIRNPVYNDIEVVFYPIPDLFVVDWCPNGPTPDQFPSKVLINLERQ